MTVQISVTVWTILCFLALMLILDKLLFRPMLSFMDARQEKIDRARARRESQQREREEELRRREDQRAQRERLARQSSAAALDGFRRETAEAVERKKAENARQMEDYLRSLADLSADIRQQLEPRLGEIAAASARRLRTWYDQPELTAEEEAAAPHAALENTSNM